jgi:hypothetical protein
LNTQRGCLTWNTLTFNLCSWYSYRCEFHPYCWKEDFILEWRCVGVSTSLVGLAILWYSSWSRIFPLYKRSKGFWSRFGVGTASDSCLSHVHVDWVIFISFLYNLMHCRVTHNFVYSVSVLLYRNCDSVNNVVSKLHAILQGTGYLTALCRLSGLTGRWWITGRCVHVKWWSWPAYWRDAWIRLDKLRRIMGTTYYAVPGVWT